MEWSVGSIARKRAGLMPEKSALIFEDQPITYRQLNEEANRVAHYFQSAGLKKGDRISVLLLNCPEFLYIYFAAAKLGLILVPLNTRLAGPEIKYQLNQCGARLFIFHDSFVNMIESIRSDISVEKDKYFYMKSLLSNAPGCPEWTLSFSETIRKFPVNEPPPRDRIDLDDPLAILFTSGVTGNPKGAVVSHGQTFFKVFQIMLRDGESTDKDVTLTQAPLFHSAGLFISATPSVCRGITMIMRQTFNPGKFAEDIEKYKVTTVFAFTTMWRIILESGKLDKIDKSSIRRVSGGGKGLRSACFKLWRIEDFICSKGMVKPRTPRWQPYPTKIFSGNKALSEYPGSLRMSGSGMRRGKSSLRERSGKLLLWVPP